MADTNVSSTQPLHLTIHTRTNLDKYPAKSHAQRVAAELNLTNGIIVLKGERAQNFSNSDQPRPFRQDRYFYYLTGCNEPDCWLTYHVDKDLLTLWIPPAQSDRLTFYNGRKMTVEEALEAYDIDEAKYIDGKTMRGSELSRMLKVHHEDGGEISFLKGSLIPVLNKAWRMAVWNCNPRPSLRLRRALDACRAVKDSHEIALVRKANEISAKAHTAILKNLHNLKSEPEVEAIYTQACIANGARSQSYPPICGSGPNAGTLHYVDNNEAFGDRKILLVDAGADWQCYASDVTRTLPINPKNPGHWPTKETEAIYNVVAKIQEASIAQLRPGKKFLEVTWCSVHMAIDALLAIGILKGDHTDIFHAGTALAFYPHGLGHHLGLEVHDVQPVPMKKDTLNRWLEASDATPNDPEPGKTPQMKRLKAAYRSFCVAHNATWWTSQALLATSPQNYSINLSACRAPNLPTSPPLQPGNIITVEPGIYFNKYMLDTFFLHDEKHRQFIDTEVLERYMHVGGVRIEDDVLIKADRVMEGGKRRVEGGMENLTTAPKGEEALRMVREGGCWGG